MSQLEHRLIYRLAEDCLYYRVDHDDETLCLARLYTTIDEVGIVSYFPLGAKMSHFNLYSNIDHTVV